MPDRTHQDSTQGAAICAAVDRLHGDQTRFLAELVRQKSLRGQEKGAQQFIEAALRERGYHVDRVATVRQPDDPRFSPGEIDYADSWNLVASAGAAGAGRSLVLNAHVDVVPEGPHERWTKSPFGAEVDGDWMYGRGAGDMKAGMAANLFALEALRLAGLRPRGQVQVQSVVEEEITGNGAASLIAAGHTADAVLIPEPTDEQLVRASSGVIKFRLSLTGAPAHPRDPDSGRSAINLMLHLLNRLQELEARWNADAGGHPGFDSLSNPASLTIGTIQGGEFIASLSAACTCEGRIGFYPGESPADRQREFEAFIADVAANSPEFRGAEAPRVEWVGVCQPGYRITPGGAAEQALERAVMATGAGVDGLRDYVMPCYLDATLFACHEGIPALTYGPVAQNIHGFDERVSLSSLARVTKAIALFVADWCGVEQISDGPG